MKKITSHAKEQESWTSTQQKKQITEAVFEGPHVLDRLHKHVKNSYFKYKMFEEVQIIMLIHLYGIHVCIYTHISIDERKRLTKI